MLFNKSLFASVLVVALSSQAYAHAVISPAIQVTGTPVRKNAVKPSTNAPCGKNVDIAASANTAQTVAANGDSFSVTVQNFNNGKDGSRQIVAAKMQVDTTGTGTSFKTGGTVTTNGDLAPTSQDQQQVTAALPAGTTCTGGADGKSCLVSMTTAGGFGNCVMVSQAGGGAAGAAAGAAGAAAGTAAGAAAGNATASGTDASAAAGIAVAAADTASAAAGTASAAASTASAAAGQGKQQKGAKNAAKGAGAGGATSNAAKAKAADAATNNAAAAGCAKNNNTAAATKAAKNTNARRSWASRHQVRAQVLVFA